MLSIASVFSTRRKDCKTDGVCIRHRTYIGDASLLISVKAAFTEAVHNITIYEWKKPFTYWGKKLNRIITNKEKQFSQNRDEGSKSFFYVVNFGTVESFPRYLTSVLITSKMFAPLTEA